MKSSLEFNKLYKKVSRAQEVIVKIIKSSLSLENKTRKISMVHTIMKGYLK